jgi:two-component system cell cycle sensor histidine kinase/response regulator CckA
MCRYRPEGTHRGRDSRLWTWQSGRAHGSPVRAIFTTKDVGEGTGLGLFICHRILSDLGGVFEVESGVGSGSVFGRRRHLGRQGALAFARPTSRGVGLDQCRRRTGALGDGRALRPDFLRLDDARDDRREIRERLPSLASDQAARTIFITGGACTNASRKFLETTENDRLEKHFDQGKLRAIVARYLD